MSIRKNSKKLVVIAEQNIGDNENRLDELKTALPTEAEFYELVNLHLLDLLQQDDIMKLDAICNELVTNLRAGNDSISVIKLNPPYDLLVDLAEISTGRAKANNPEPDLISLLHSLKKGWNSESFTKNTEPILTNIDSSEADYATKSKAYNY